MTKYILKRVIYTLLILLAVSALIFTIVHLGEGNPAEMMAAKPVIYLYPESRTAVSVELHIDGELSVTYPEYNGGWNVIAMPDGTLTDLTDGNEYSYLFWEAKMNTEYDFSQGFCVRGEDTARFLRDILARMGLAPREYNEFIVYWYPLMKDNAYNLISFQGENYENAAELTVNPAPDSVLRVFMAWKAVDSPVDIEPQSFSPFIREGFTLVEWGGSEIK